MSLPRGAGGRPAAEPVSTDPLTPVEVPALPPSDAVTWLKVVGGSLWLPLDRTRFAFSLGSGLPTQVDLSLPIKYVSRLHCRLERDGNWLVVTNLSRNGTYVAGRREERAPVLAGDCFTVGSTELFALDDHLRALHGTLERFLGYTAHAAIDRALVLVARRAPPPLVLTGPGGSEPERLAEAIHRGSARRDLPFVVIDPLAAQATLRTMIAHADTGSVFVDLRALRGKRASAALADALFGSRAKVRALLAAPSLDIALGAFDGRGRRLEQLGRGRQLEAIDVPPVAARGHEVPALFDALLQEHGSRHRFTELRTDRQEALCAFDWPENHHDLRRATPRLAAYLAAQGNVSAAARALGVDDSTLAEALERIGLLVRRSRVAGR